MRGEVVCGIARCGKRWPRDPVLEVPCPKCGAAVGHPCVVRRPSGHVHGAQYGGLSSWGHDERDMEADRQGKYGPCPLGHCGADRPVHPDQMPLFPDAPTEATSDA